MSNQDKLRTLMDEHGLTRRQVAELLGLPMNSNSGRSCPTLDNWLSGRRNMPDMALELLRMKLKSETA